MELSLSRNLLGGKSFVLRRSHTAVSFFKLDALSTIVFETALKSKSLSLVSLVAAAALDEIYGPLAAVEFVWASTHE